MDNSGLYRDTLAGHHLCSCAIMAEVWFLMPIVKPPKFGKAANTLTLTFDDKELKRKLTQVVDAVRVEATEKALNASAMFMIAWIKIYMDKVLNRQTGNLIGSVQVDEMAVHSEGGYITFGPHTIYAAIHEFGGIILPTNGPYLVFKGSDGNWVKTKSVHMPARPYIRPAIDEHGQEALDLMGTTMGAVIEKSWSE
jgi:HK97 gp10 family phage protein